MTTIDVSISFIWQPAGAVELDLHGKLRFPKTTNAPSLYRFDLTGPSGVMIYIGEADKLARRLQHYRTPGLSQPTNLRLNGLMREILGKGGTVVLSVPAEPIVIKKAGAPFAICLDSKSNRVLLEHAALLEAKASGAK